MMRIEIVKLLELDSDAQIDGILGSRPEDSRSRVQWWIQVFDTVVWDLGKSDAPDIRGDILNLALLLLEVAERDGDFSPVDSLVVLVRLESFALRANDATVGFSPDRIAMRALSAIPIGMTEVPAAIERERKFLMEDDRA